MTETQTLVGVLIAGISALFGLLVWIGKVVIPEGLKQYRADVREERAIFQVELAKRDDMIKEFARVIDGLSSVLRDNTLATKALTDQINKHTVP